MYSEYYLKFTYLLVTEYNATTVPISIDTSSIDIRKWFNKMLPVRLLTNIVALVMCSVLGASVSW